MTQNNKRRTIFRNRKKEQAKNIANKNINSLINNIEDSLSDIYSDTYLSSKKDIDNMNYIADKIEDNINSIIQRNNIYNVSNTSKLYSRLMRQSQSSSISKKKEDTMLNNELENLFNDSNLSDNVIGQFLENNWIAELDKEIDSILKYCPNINEALDILKDAVLSADSTSKEFIFPVVNISDDTKQKIVIDRIDNISKKYELSRRIEDWYDDASKYGEVFIYNVPYNKAISQLLNRKKDITTTSIIESGAVNPLEIELTQQEMKKINIDKNISFNVEIDTNNILESAVEEIRQINKKVINNNSLNESFKSDILNESKTIENNKIIPDDLSIDDGLINTNYKANFNNNKSNNVINIRGAVVKKLERKNLIRIYIEDTLLGYYYVEFKNNDNILNKNISDTIGVNSLSNPISDSNISKSENEDMLMKKIAMQMSQKLDATFINNNQDLSKEIYAILKYNDIFNSSKSMKVTFIPPEDIKWLRFREKNHIGISDLYESMIPAKLLSLLYITYVTGTLTRGQDKRVYYVKQSVETNIAQTLMNVINQIKKNNFNLRSIDNLNNILNITGRFNDYVIPVGPSGDSPIQFEIMPGQEFQINQELFDLLTESAVNPIVPLELIQARLSPEYATQYTTSSLKLLRKTYRRQNRMQEFISALYTDIYLSEYEEYEQIYCNLPTPVFLSIANTSQLLQNTKEYYEIIAELEYASDQDDNVDIKKATFINKMIKNTIGTYIKPSEIEKIKEISEFEVNKKINSNSDV